MALENHIFELDTFNLGLCSTELKNLCDLLGGTRTSRLVAEDSTGEISRELTEEISLVELSLRLAADLSAERIHLREENCQKIIGRGGFGKVIYAEIDGRPYAVKLFLPLRQNRSRPDNPHHALRLRKMCSNESRIQEKAAELIYNVPFLIGSGIETQQNIPYIAMEYINGPTLSRYKRKRNLVKNLQHTQTLASYLETLHQHGVIHNDIKPDNLVIARRGAEEKLFLLDFGLAADKGGSYEHLSYANDILGTPAYLPPESFTPGKIEDKVTSSVDQYGLGITLYEAATGKRTFKHMNLGQIIRTKNERIKEYFSFGNSCIPGCPAQIEEVVLRCTNPDPDKRYSCCGEVAETLKEIIKKIN